MISYVLSLMDSSMIMNKRQWKYIQYKYFLWWNTMKIFLFYSILFYPFVNDLIVNNKRKEDEITINSSYLIRYKWIQVKIDDLK